MSLHEPASLHAQMLEPQTMSTLEDIVSLFDMGRRADCPRLENALMTHIIHDLYMTYTFMFWPVVGALLCNSIQQTVRKTLNLAPAAGDKARTLLLRPMRGTHAKGSLAQIESRQIVPLWPSTFHAIWGVLDNYRLSWLRLGRLRAGWWSRQRQKHWAVLCMTSLSPTVPRHFTQGTQGAARETVVYNVFRFCRSFPWLVHLYKPLFQIPVSSCLIIGNRRKYPRL